MMVNESANGMDFSLTADDGWRPAATGRVFVRGLLVRHSQPVECIASEDRRVTAKNAWRSDMVKLWRPFRVWCFHKASLLSL